MNTEERLDRLEKAIETSGTATKRPVYLFVAIGFLVGCATGWAVWNSWDNFRIHAIAQWGGMANGPGLLESIRLLSRTIVVLCIVVLTTLGFVVGRLWNR